RRSCPYMLQLLWYHNSCSLERLETNSSSRDRILLHRRNIHLYLRRINPSITAAPMKSDQLEA
ncbi:hypothetical protein PENTCL1PPCAC_26234, partial [Pristionchus entomophagus]